MLHHSVTPKYLKKLRNTSSIHNLFKRTDGTNEKDIKDISKNYKSATFYLQFRCMFSSCESEKKRVES